MSEEEQQHTPEPWHLGLQRVTAGKICAKMGDDEYVVADTNWNFPDDAKANARRIVACVNACAGVATADLEEVGGNFGAVYADAKKRNSELEQQRDALLAALTTLCDRLPKNPQSLAQYHAYEELMAARAAIAAAT